MFEDKRCTNHPAKRALSFCRYCKAFYCEACLTEAGDHYYCAKPACQSSASAAMAAAAKATRAAYARHFCPQCMETTEATEARERSVLMNGIGFRLGRRTNECPLCHSAEARMWFCLFYIPLVPVARYRLAFIGPDCFILRRIKQNPPPVAPTIIAAAADPAVVELEAEQPKQTSPTMDSYPEIRFKHAATGEEAFTRIGGDPDWIQVEWEPECCGSPMRFLAQIDSIDMPDTDLPDCASIYVFVCPKCFETTSQLQCF